MEGQVFTVAKLHYINGVVYNTAIKGITDLSALAENYPETTKSGDVKHPLVRVRTLARLAQGIGLITITKDNQVKITDLGKKYYEARSDDKWSLSENQQKLLCEYILANPTRTKTIHAITSLLKLAEQGYQGKELSSLYSKAIGKDEAWISDVTFEGFTQFGLSYIEELGLLKNQESKNSVSKDQDQISRNPKWTRDELILALDLYFRFPPQKINQDHPEVIKLSDILNSLPIHPRKSDYEKFRNPNGVYMKLCNFLRFDPSYKGAGLKAGGKLEEDIWNEFAGDLEVLHSVSMAIVENATEVPRPSIVDIDEDEEFEEGRILTKLHKMRERSPGLSAKKKQSVLNKTGKLKCEACGFDFEDFYGDIGKGLAESHHTKPVSMLKKGETTRLKDLAILCANCHRVIHCSKPMVSIFELQDIISKQTSDF